MLRTLSFFLILSLGQARYYEEHENPSVEQLAGLTKKLPEPAESDYEIHAETSKMDVNFTRTASDDEPVVLSFMAKQERNRGGGRVKKNVRTGARPNKNGVKKEKLEEAAVTAQQKAKSSRTSRARGVDLDETALEEKGAPQTSKRVRSGIKGLRNNAGPSASKANGEGTAEKQKDSAGEAKDGSAEETKGATKGATRSAPDGDDAEDDPTKGGVASKGQGAPKGSNRAAPDGAGVKDGPAKDDAASKGQGAPKGSTRAAPDGAGVKDGPTKDDVASKGQGASKGSTRAALDGADVKDGPTKEDVASKGQGAPKGSTRSAPDGGGIKDGPTKEDVASKGQGAIKGSTRAAPDGADDEDAVSKGKQADIDAHGVSKGSKLVESSSTYRAASSASSAWAASISYTTKRGGVEQGNRRTR